MGLLVIPLFKSQEKLLGQCTCQNSQVLLCPRGPSPIGHGLVLISFSRGEEQINRYFGRWRQTTSMLKKQMARIKNPCCSRLAVILLPPEFICVIQHQVSDSLEKMNHVSLGSHCLIETLQTNPFCVYCDPSWGHSGHHSKIFPM